MDKKLLYITFHDHVNRKERIRQFSIFYCTIKREKKNTISLKEFNGNKIFYFFT